MNLCTIVLQRAFSQFMQNFEGQAGALQALAAIGKQVGKYQHGPVIERIT